MRNPSERLEVLVFNRHEPHICLFAHSGHNLQVAPSREHPHRSSNRACRLLPDNAVEVSWEHAEPFVGRRALDPRPCGGYRG